MYKTQDEEKPSVKENGYPILRNFGRCLLFPKMLHLIASTFRSTLLISNVKPFCQQVRTRLKLAVRFFFLTVNPTLLDK